VRSLLKDCTIDRRHSSPSCFHCELRHVAHITTTTEYESNSAEGLLPVYKVEGFEQNIARIYSTSDKLQNAHLCRHGSRATDCLMDRWDTGRLYKQAELNRPCMCCIVSKATEWNKDKDSYRYMNYSMGDHMSMDLSVEMGPSEEGYKHFLLVQEWWSRYIHVYFLRTKAEAHDWAVKHIRTFKNRFGFAPRTLHVDNELNSFKVREALGHNDLVTTPPGQSQLNPHAERPIRTVNERQRAFRRQGNAPHSYWPVSVGAAVGSLNLEPPLRELQRFKDGKGQALERPLTPDEK
jgi:hypothetical protein